MVHPLAICALPGSVSFLWDSLPRGEGGGGACPRVEKGLRMGRGGKVLIR